MRIKRIIFHKELLTAGVYVKKKDSLMKETGAMPKECFVKI
jgi:hypothetical protein